MSLSKSSLSEMKEACGNPTNFSFHFSVFPVVHLILLLFIRGETFYHILYFSFKFFNTVAFVYMIFFSLLPTSCNILNTELYYTQHFLPFKSSYPDTLVGVVCLVSLQHHFFYMQDTDVRLYLYYVRQSVHLHQAVLTDTIHILLFLFCFRNHHVWDSNRPLLESCTRVGPLQHIFL